MQLNRRLMCAAAGAWLAASAASVSAQNFPEKSIRFIIPQTTGGTSDILGRMVALKLSERIRHPVVVDNRAGASGTIGTAMVAKAPGDGYTLLLAYTTHSTAPALYGELPYDPIRSFAALTLLGSAPLVLTVPPRVPAATVAEFIKVARSSPRSLAFGSAGNGSGGHLAGELFKLMAQVPTTHIPYRGTGQALTELVGGQLDFMFAAIVPVQPYVKGGRLRAIAVSSLKRSTSMAELPTVSEAGVPGFEYIGWYGVLAPAATPKAIVDRLNAEFVAVVRLPEMRERFLADGAEPVGNTSAEFAAFLKTDLERWSKVIKMAGAKID